MDTLVENLKNAKIPEDLVAAMTTGDTIFMDEYKALTQIRQPV